VSDSVRLPPLKPLHPDTSHRDAKLTQLDRIQTDTIEQSLRPGLKDSLKVRQDGTIMDGHHRLKVLRSRGVDVDALPREIIVREKP
jgi:ParB-like chromosome segregation protein Spo0J